MEAKTKHVTFSYELGGIEATYTRFDNDGNPHRIPLTVYPFTANVEVVESASGHARKRYARIDVLWVDFADLNFILKINGTPPLQVEGDEISFRVGDKMRHYKVTGYQRTGEKMASAILNVESKAETQ
jgi:hypothetical protein